MTRSTLAGALLLALVAAPVAAETPVELQLSFGWDPVHRTITGQSHGGSLGLAVLVRPGPFVAGPLAILSLGYGRVLDDSIHLGVEAGVTRALAEAWRLVLVGEGGMHLVFSIREDRDYGFLQGANQQGRVSLPYLGARAGVSWEYRHRSRSERGFFRPRTEAIGASLFARRDLGTDRVVVEYSELWVRDPERVGYSVGGWSAGVALDGIIGW